MAYISGVATDANDLLEVIRDFIKNNPELVAAGQNWEELAYVPKRLKTFSTNATVRAEYRPESIVSSITGRLSDAEYPYVRFESMDEFTVFDFEFMQPEPVASVEIALNTALTNPKEFDVYYSSDGDVWTHAEKITVPTSWAARESKILDLSVSPGAYKYWRVTGFTSVINRRIDMYRFRMLDSAGGVLTEPFAVAYFKSTGLAGMDEIFIGFMIYDLPSVWEITLRPLAAAGFNSSNLAPTAQPSTVEETEYCPAIPIHDGAMPYWLTANGRCVRGAIEIAGRYESFYLGFFLPYASPLQYPYPMCVAGTMTDYACSRERQHIGTREHSCFIAPGSGGARTGIKDGSMWVYGAGGWQPIITRTRGTGETVTLSYGMIAPYLYRTTANLPPGDSITDRNVFTDRTVNGDRILMPISIGLRSPAGSEGLFGELDGVFCICGEDLSVEEELIIDGKTYKVFPNIGRFGYVDFYALEIG